MENVVEKALESIDGYWISFEKNTENGRTELKIGLPNSWVFKGNKNISCQVVNKSTAGKLIMITGEKDNVTIDDLIDFVGKIIETNERISEKEKQFMEEMEGVKKILEDKQKNFYKELEELKENSFNKFKEETNAEKKTTPKKQTKRGRPPKSKTDDEKVGKEDIVDKS